VGMMPGNSEIEIRADLRASFNKECIEAGGVTLEQYNRQGANKLFCFKKETLIKIGDD